MFISHWNIEKWIIRNENIDYVKGIPRHENRLKRVLHCCSFQLTLFIEQCVQIEMIKRFIVPLVPKTPHHRKKVLLWGKLHPCIQILFYSDYSLISSRDGLACSLNGHEDCLPQRSYRRRYLLSISRGLKWRTGSCMYAGCRELFMGSSRHLEHGTRGLTAIYGRWDSSGVRLTTTYTSCQVRYLSY